MITKKNLKIFKKLPYIYFDNAASSIKSQIFIEEYSKLLNINTQITKEEIFSLSTKIANFLITKPENISFFFNSSYAINEIAKKISELPSKIYTIFISESEHLSNVLIWLKIAKEKEWQVIFFPIEEHLLLKVNKFSIVTFSLLTNLDGYEVDYEKVIEKYRDKEAILILDASQSIVHDNISLNNDVVDFLFFTAHKFFGPNGIGVVFSKQKYKNFGINTSLSIDQYENYQLDWKALMAWNISFLPTIEKIKKIKGQKHKLNEYFLKNFPNSPHIKLINKNTKSLLFLIAIKKISSHDFLFFLEKNKIIARSGLSCSYSPKYQKIASTLIRISLNVTNNTKEIDKFFKLIKEFNIADAF